MWLVSTILDSTETDISGVLSSRDINLSFAVVQCWGLSHWDPSQGPSLIIRDITSVFNMGILSCLPKERKPCKGGRKSTHFRVPLIEIRRLQGLFGVYKSMFNFLKAYLKYSRCIISWNRLLERGLVLHSKMHFLSSIFHISIFKVTNWRQ